MSPLSAELSARLGDRVRMWRVEVERVTETESSVLAFGTHENRPVVVKVAKNGGDERRSGEVLRCFDGIGVVRVYDHIDGASLLEQLRPGESLVSLSLNGADDDATAVLVATMSSMSPRMPTWTVPTALDWGKAFEWYQSSGDLQIAATLVSQARRVYTRLCGSQTRTRLLHGDLHHGNVLFDRDRGWLAVDAKGVIGELEYEAGAALRNPYERPDIYASPAIIERRVERLSRELGLDSTRLRAWAFAQAVLAAIWAVEDGLIIEPGNGWIRLATAIQSMHEM